MALCTLGKSFTNGASSPGLVNYFKRYLDSRCPLERLEVQMILHGSALTCLQRYLESVQRAHLQREAEGIPTIGYWPRSPHHASRSHAPERVNAPFTCVPLPLPASRSSVSCHVAPLGHPGGLLRVPGKVLPSGVGGIRFPTEFSAGLSGHVLHGAAARLVIARQRLHAFSALHPSSGGSGRRGRTWTSTASSAASGRAPTASSSKPST